MNPFPGPNSVIIMDNASIHKSWELHDMIERRCVCITHVALTIDCYNRGMKLQYLPTYSLDLNPIEEALSSIKAWIRGNCDYAHSELVPDDLEPPFIRIFSFGRLCSQLLHLRRLRAGSRTAGTCDTIKYIY